MLPVHETEVILESERSDGLPGDKTPLAQSKRRSAGAAERDGPLRLLWRVQIGRTDPERLVFVDEMGTHLLLGPPLRLFSKVKHTLRKIVARGKEALIEAMSRALGAASTEDVGGYFAHCGYRAPAQQL